ncbi:uncharacterized protein LOC143358603 [Halictus rubicundus]|uniref:uncharacterized protein LOC143358603 n=1 Tax=Halictus rubicundus TaxID=77578 RepID=UPI004036E6B2
MSPVGLAFVGLISVALAKPGILSSPLIATLTPAAPVGPDGRVVDTAEVAVAKAAHAAAQVNERINLANEAVRSTLAGQDAVINPVSTLVSAGPAVSTLVGAGPAVSTLVGAGQAVLVPGSPIGPDGRVVDTAEVAVAKAAHAAAQINERVTLANEAARSIGADLNRPASLVVGGLGGVPTVAVGLDGVRSGAATIVAAGQAGLSVPLVAGNTVLVPGAQIGPDGRVQDTVEVAVAKAAHAAAHVNEKLNLANEAAKSAGVISVATPGLNYGRLVY